jgi:ABC-type spermidine/putrescine transport system permease subunit II
MAFNLDPSLNAIGTVIFVFSLLLLIGVEILLLPILLKGRERSEAEVQ